MAKRKGEFSNHGWGVGVDIPKDLLDELDSYTNGEMDKVLIKALHKSSRNFKKSLEDFMSPSRRKYGTGETLDYFIDVFQYNGTEVDGANPSLVNSKRGVIKVDIGFDITGANSTNLKGLPALFLDVGTPTIKPTFFVYYARQSSSDEMKKVQIETVKAFIRGETN